MKQIVANLEVSMQVVQRNGIRQNSKLYAIALTGNLVATCQERTRVRECFVAACELCS